MSASKIMNSDSIAIEAATDGACSGNPGPGGWGGLIIFDDNSELEIGGSEQNTTNNRMELTAAIKTLEKLKTYKIKENFKLRTDSKLSLIHISEPTRRTPISYAVFCLKKKCS